MEVLPIIKKTIDLDLTIVIDNDYDAASYQSTLYSLVTTTLNEYTVSDDFYLSDLIHAIKNAYDDIVVNIVITKGSDVEIENNELIRAGEINLNCVILRDWRS